MTPALRIVLMVLALVELAAAAAVVLQIDRRSKRLRGRVERLGAAPAPPAAAPERMAVRRTGQASAQRRLVHMIFNIPEHTLPGARLPVVAAGATALLVGGVSGMATAFLASPLLAPFAALGSAVLTVRVLFTRQHRTYARKLLLQMPDTIELVVSAVRAGLPIAEALRSVAREMPSPTSDEFTQVCNAIALGVPPDVAIRGIHDRSGLTEYGIFSVTLAVQSRSGGRLAETIQNLAETTRQRVAMAAKARALSSEARISAIALEVLPMLSGVLLTMENPTYLLTLVDRPTGHELIAIAAATLTIGTLVMRWMIRWASEP